jgi:hypothetical protein
LYDSTIASPVSEIFSIGFQCSITRTGCSIGLLRRTFSFAHIHTTTSELSASDRSGKVLPGKSVRPGKPYSFDHTEQPIEDSVISDTPSFLSQVWHFSTFGRCVTLAVRHFIDEERQNGFLSGMKSVISAL